MIIGVTGPRPQNLWGWNVPNPIYDYVKLELTKKLIALKPTKVISGMALGVDTLVVELCIELNIPFIAAVPFKGQESKWNKELQDKYKELLSKALEIVIVSDGGYSIDKMQIRNKWIVDNSDLIIGVWNGSPGGTANCVRYIKEVNKPIEIINPNNV